MKRGFIGLVAACVLLFTTVASASAYDDFSSDPSAQGTGARFTMAVLPDTQFYARYADPQVGDKYTPRWGSEPFAAQSQWLVDHRDDYNIAFTTHLGDLVDQSDKPGQWQVASKDMKILEDADMPYSVLAGNHDIGGTAPDDYLSTFSPERAARQSTFGERSPSGWSEYHTFTAQGQEFLVLAISWEAEQDIAWAKQVLAAHPTTPTILTSHQILNITADGQQALDTDFGTMLWNELVNDNDQVFLTLNGHHHGAVQRVKKNAAGNDVLQVLMDYQMAFAGGNGNMGLIEFDLTHGRITGTAFSPWVLEKPADTLIAEFDQALLDGPGDTYSIPFDFASRFDGITDAGTDPSYTVKLRQDLASQYTNPDVVEPRPAADADDYPKVEGTLAHWRVDPTKIVDGQTLNDGDTIPVGGRLVDIAGDADMTRAPVGTMLTTGFPDDVTFTADHHPYSAGSGAACFANSSRAVNRTNWFSTEVGKAVNTEKFPNGYTFETFVKVDEEFTADDNQWMVAVGRSGDRERIDPDAMVEGGEPPVALAFSNLQEFQWSFMATNRPENDWADGSAWSGDIDTERWFHVAVTNDPDTKETTLFVNGAPMLRSTSGLTGLDAAANSVWTIGGDSDGIKTDHGWLGCVGETRIVDHVIDTDQWLTARAVTPTPDPTPTATPTPTAEPTAEPTPSQEAPVPTVEPEPTTEPTPEPTPSVVEDPSASASPAPSTTPEPPAPTGSASEEPESSAPVPPAPESDTPTQDSPDQDGSGPARRLPSTGGTPLMVLMTALVATAAGSALLKRR